MPLTARPKPTSNFLSESEAMDPNQALKDALSLFAESKYEEAREALQPVIEHVCRCGFAPTMVSNFVGQSTEEINRLERIILAYIIEYIDGCVAEKILNDLIGELPDDTENTTQS